MGLMRDANVSLRWMMLHCAALPAGLSANLAVSVVHLLFPLSWVCLHPEVLGSDPCGHELTQSTNQPFEVSEMSSNYRQLVTSAKIVL